jgi:hypothetical protein
MVWCRIAVRRAASATTNVNRIETEDDAAAVGGVTTAGCSISTKRSKLLISGRERSGALTDLSMAARSTR